MVKKLKKNKFKILTYLFCAFSIALFAIVSFSCKTYAYTIDSNGNLVGDNVWNYQDTMTNTNVGITGTLNGSILDLNGTNTGTGGWLFQQSIPLNITSGTYTLKYYGITTNYGFALNFYDSNNNNIVDVGYVTELTFTINTDITSCSIWITGNGFTYDNQKIKIMLNEGTSAKEWEPYGVWYSEDNYDALQEDYDTLSNVKNKIEQDYKTLVNVNNYGMWAYLTGYVWDSSITMQGNIQFRGIDSQGNYVSSIKVPDRNSYSFTYEDLMRNGLLEVGGILNTTTLQELGTYESNLRYNISCLFNHLPTNSFFMRFENVNNFTIRIMDYNDREVTLYKNSDIVSFTYQDIYNIDNQFGNEIYGIWINNSAYSNNDTMGQFITYDTNTESYNLGYADARQNYRYYIEEVENQAQEINNLREQINKTYNDRYNEGYQDGYNIGTSSNNQLYNMIIAVADTPISIFKQIFNFNILGLDISGFIFGIISLLIIIWLIKKII